MGEHSGTFFFDGGEASTEVDGSNTWIGESASPPPRSPTGLVIAWDGRLDNRDDVLMRLGASAGDGWSDASIALAAFERWNVEGLGSLTGEWSAAIWDRGLRTLHLARDWMGVCPLYYAVDARTVSWSTSLAQLVDRSSLHDDLSEEFVARFMGLRFSCEVTPYDRIRAVPSACCLSFAPSRVYVRRRFWKLNPGNLRYRDRRQYEEHLRALWSDAVAARLRTDNDVWAELSGGLDSSSVVCMAEHLIRSGRVPARRVQPLSHVTLHSPEGDERRFIAEVEARIGAPSEILGVEAHEDAVDADLDWVTPHAVRGVSLASDRLIRGRGGRVVLSGRAGDAVMGCEPDNSVAVLDDLGGGHPLIALSKMRQWSRASRKPFVEIAWRLARGVSRPHAGVGGAALLTSRLARIALADDPDRTGAIARVRRSKRDLAGLVLGYAFDGRLTIPGPPPGVVYTYPFIHRPLIEFVFAIPGDQLSAPSDMRSLMRRAFGGLVPPRILQRTSKGYYPPAAMRAVRPLVAAMRPVEGLEIVRRGWIDPARLDDGIRMLLEGGQNDGGAVRRALRLEQWLASRKRRAPAVRGFKGFKGFDSEGKEVRSHEVLNA